MAARAIHYEVTLLPPVEGGPWRYVATITHGSGPDSVWTSPPATLAATDRESAAAEAKVAVKALTKVLAG